MFESLGKLKKLEGRTKRQHLGMQHLVILHSLMMSITNDLKAHPTVLQITDCKFFYKLWKTSGSGVLKSIHWVGTFSMYTEQDSWVIPSSTFSFTFLGGSYVRRRKMQERECKQPFSYGSTHKDSAEGSERTHH